MTISDDYHAIINGRLEPIVVGYHDPMPALLGATADTPLIGIDHVTPDAFAIYGAYYFVMPVSVPAKEPA